MSKINFFTAVDYEGKPHSLKQSALQAVDNYFYLGGKKAVVLGEKADQTQTVLKPVCSSRLGNVAKIVSYTIIPIPIIMLIAKGILRSLNHVDKFSVIDLEKQEGTPASKVDTVAKQVIENDTRSPPTKPNAPPEEEVLTKQEEKFEIETGTEEKTIKNETRCQSTDPSAEPEEIASIKEVAREIDLKKEREVKAAIVLQKYARGHLARKPLLSRELYSKYTSEVKKTNDPKLNSQIPKASDGKTIVFLPRDVTDVVLKKSGRNDAIKRFHQMQHVRSILNTQKSTHLVIPKARLYKDYLVEERLPVNTDSFHNMGLYIENPHRFDGAVREFVRLFSKIGLSDIVTMQRLLPLSHIDDVNDHVRWDNLPLYIDANGEGNVGLIDLEHTHEGPGNIEDLARIFPYHLDMIKEEADRLGIEVDANSLEMAAKKGKKYLQVGYIDHLNWLKQKEVLTKQFEISSDRVAELQPVLAKELLRLNQSPPGIVPANRFLIGDPEKAAKELAASMAPWIITNLKSALGSKDPSSLGRYAVRGFEFRLINFLTENPEIKLTVSFKDLKNSIIMMMTEKLKSMHVSESGFKESEIDDLISPTLNELCDLIKKHAKISTTKDGEARVHEFSTDLVSDALTRIKERMLDIDRTLSESELVSLRSPVLNRSDLFDGVSDLLPVDPQLTFDNALIPLWIGQRSEIAKQLVTIVIEELIKSGDIFAYDPADYTMGYHQCWVRF